MSLKLNETAMYETLTDCGLTDEEIRLQAVKIAQGNNMACCGIETILQEAKKIFDFIKTGQTLKTEEEIG
jgi:hypothetical protein